MGGHFVIRTLEAAFFEQQKERVEKNVDFFFLFA